MSVAAQASVLLLHREPAFYSTLRTILVYPCSHLANSTYDENSHAHRLGDCYLYATAHTMTASLVSSDWTKRTKKLGRIQREVVLHLTMGE